MGQPKRELSETWQWVIGVMVLFLAILVMLINRTDAFWD